MKQCKNLNQNKKIDIKKGVAQMPKEKIKSLFQHLRDHLPEAETSPQQQALLDQLAFHLHTIDQPDPKEPSLRELLELLVEEIELEHPKSAAITRQLLDSLSALGL